MDSEVDYAPDEPGFGWEMFDFANEAEANEFYEYVEAGMDAEASAVVDRVYERMFAVRG